jgi:hypothetical protein
MASTPTDAGAAAEVAPGVHLERLALRVAGLDEAAAVALARLVAQRLAPGLLRVPGAAGLDSLKVEVRAEAVAAVAPDQLAERIVDQIGRALARAGASDDTGAVAP